MRFLKTISILTLLFHFLFSDSGIVLGSPQENPLIKAIQLFDKGEFTEAEPILQKLLAESPDNLMLNYYYAACRTENLFFGSTELNCLLTASKTEAPLKADYYLANQYHAAEQWELALKYYTRYKLKVDEKEQELVKLSEKIQQCFNEENPYPETAKEIISLVQDTITSSAETAADTIFNISIQNIPEAKKEDSTFVPIISPPIKPVAVKKIEKEESPINFRVNSSILYTSSSQFKTENGKLMYFKAIEKQNELDQNLQQSDNLRKAYNAANSEENKLSIGKTILSLEEDAYLLKEELKNLLFQAKNKEYDYWENANTEEWEQFKQANFSNKETSETQEFTKTHESDEFNPDLLLLRDKSLQQNTVSNESELVYKIQIGAFSKGIPNYMKRLFKKLSLIRKIENYTDEQGVVVYTTGNLSTLEDAVKMQKQVKQEGAEDAIIVPYFNGKRITLKRAKEITIGK